MENKIYEYLDNAINNTDQSDYTDAYDWMNVVFGQVENELEDEMDTDGLRMDYDEYVLAHWEGEDDFFDDED